MDIYVLHAALLVFIVYLLVHAVLMKVLKEKQVRTVTPLLFVWAMGGALYIIDFSRIEAVVLAVVILALLIAVHTITIFSLIFEKPLKMRLVDVLASQKGQSLQEIKETLSSKVILDDSLKHLLATGRITANGQTYAELKGQRKLFLVGSIADGLRSLLNTSQK